MRLHHFQGNIPFRANAPRDDAHMAYTRLAEFGKEIAWEIHFLIMNKTGEVRQIARRTAKAFLDFCSAPIKFVVDVANNVIIKFRARRHYLSNPSHTPMPLHASR